MSKPAIRFPIGQRVAGSDALAAIEATREGAMKILERHLANDWGDVDDEDKQANDWSLANEAHVRSAYVLADGTRIWIITEANRASTRILPPEEY